jgi:hypothetical protein
MDMRSPALQAFVDAAATAYRDHARDPASRDSVAASFESLETPKAATPGSGQRLPACEHLDAALDAASADPSLARLVEAFRAIVPSLTWRRRSFDGTASANFENGHANAMILGPGGCEDRQDVWLGASLMAPNVRYPDHAHGPEEVYLALSEGEFQQGDGDWFAPGIGGSFYNEPRIRHAMRSLDRPFLALWILREATPAEASRA